MGIEGVSQTGYGTSTISTQQAQASQAEKAQTPEVAAAQASAADAPQQPKTEAAPKGKENEDKNLAQEARDDQIKKAISEINKKAMDSEAVFGIHEKTNRVTIKIVDKKTKDVIKELPPEKTLDLIAKAWELAGLMVDEKR